MTGPRPPAPGRSRPHATAGPGNPGNPGNPGSRTPLAWLLAGLALLAAAATTRAALLPTPASLEYHLLHALPEATGQSINYRQNIHFCDFFNQDTLSPGAPDGLDDLVFYDSHYVFEASPDDRASGDAPTPGTRRPVHFAHAGVQTFHCASKVPFPLAPLTYLDTYYSPAFGHIQEIFHSAVQDIMYQSNGLFASEYSLGSIVPPVLITAYPMGPGQPRSGLLSLLRTHALFGRVVHLSSNADAQPHVVTFQLGNFLDVTSMASVDLDNDGLPEALVAGKLQGMPADVYVLTHLSRFLDPTLSGGARYLPRGLLQLPAGFIPGNIILGDFDGDGHASDIALVSDHGSTTSPMARDQIVPQEVPASGEPR
ncbi:hypothetical protein H696_05696 [Fonticula alba]|uniref:Uncharacterized protein n=1 Tax=Fonticula alba TaxID=691883 RepID=A0A058Z0T9_FONAL|nr:hypothetical protein H696_05696 [Fonticula alba]KCV67756.1 hypothetical protein H696_05696 [Fonticula alba]|eukprot:XP_009497787.1 hypothetical protein H696_05696 [Fonticula alba]